MIEQINSENRKTIKNIENEIEVLGKSTYYKEVLPTNSSGTILALHGDFGTSSWAYDQVLEKIGQDYRLVVPDRPGHGRSDELKLTPKINNQIAWLNQLVTNLNLERFTLIAHSLASALAIKFANHHPEKLDKLVLISPLWRFSDLPRKLLRYRPIAKNPITINLLPISYLKELLVISQIDKSRDSLILDLETRQRIKDGMKRLSRRTILALSLDVARLDLSEEAEKINIPTLILEGEQSRLVKPESARILHQKIRGSRLERFTECGHNLHLEQPEIFSQKVMDFLR